MCICSIFFSFFLFLLLESVQDTFRGRVCECPVVNGVQYRGDGYSSCQGIVFLHDKSKILLCDKVW